MIFSKGQMSINLQFKYNGKNIEIVKDFNYLGIYFSRSGSFKTCKKQQAEKAITHLTSTYVTLIQVFTWLFSGTITCIV
jgi:hypothetical protein